MEIKKYIKPLSVNRCYKGRRFKTNEYKNYEAILLRTLPDLILPKPPYKISFEFGFSSASSDYDNPVKPLQDILQKRYGFNDKNIFYGTSKKVKVNKGEEYFLVKLESLD